MIIWHYGWKPLIVSNHPTKFGGHRHFGNGDIKGFFCHVMLQDRVIKGLHDLMGKNTSKYWSYALWNWRYDYLSLSRDLSKCHVTLWVGVLHGKSPYCTVCGHRHCGSGDIMILICHVISQDYLTQKLCDFLARSASR